MEEETATTTKKEYGALKSDSAFLCCLQAAGVDNWQGYDAAQEMMNEED